MIKHIVVVGIAAVGIVIVEHITVVATRIHEIKMGEMIHHRHVCFDHLHFYPSINSRLDVEQESFF